MRPLAGDFLLFDPDPRDLVSVLIARGQYWGEWNRRDKYTHIAIALGGETMIEAHVPGVVVAPITPALAKRITIFRPKDVPGEVWSAMGPAIAQAAAKYLGRPFDRPNMVRLGLKHYLFPNLRWEYDDAHRLICSELACRAARDVEGLAEYGVTFDHHPEDCTPRRFSEKPWLAPVGRLVERSAP